LCKNNKLINIIIISDITFEPSAPADNPSSAYSSPGYSSSYYSGYGEDTKKRKPSYATPYYPRM